MNTSSTNPVTKPKSSWNFAKGEPILAAYRAIRRLGGGKVFEVYLARDEGRRANVVCKLLRPDHVTAAPALRQLRRESQVLATLSHPAIVRKLDAALDGPRPHLLLEYVPRITLQRRLRRRGPLTFDRALPLALRLGGALHYLAAEQVVHLDVKPSNILLGPQPLLIDFSVARTLEACARLRRPVGTAAYMAPEQCAAVAGGRIGSAADIWGLGVTLYEAVSGALPFGRPGKAASEAHVRYPQLRGEPRPLKGDFPAAFSAIILRCLERDPAARPTAAEIVAMLGAN